MAFRNFALRAALLLVLGQANYNCDQDSITQIFDDWSWEGNGLKDWSGHEAQHVGFYYAPGSIEGPWYVYNQDSVKTWEGRYEVLRGLGPEVPGKYRTHLLLKIRDWFFIGRKQTIVLAANCRFLG